jgi:antibiotic biosynthesis monooxygenase (ABM) superfamily enzyme
MVGSRLSPEFLPWTNRWLVEPACLCVLFDFVAIGDVRVSTVQELGSAPPWLEVVLSPEFLPWTSRWLVEPACLCVLFDFVAIFVLRLLKGDHLCRHSGSRAVFPLDGLQLNWIYSRQDSDDVSTLHVC